MTIRRPSAFLLCIAILGAPRLSIAEGDAEATPSATPSPAPKPPLPLTQSLSGAAKDAFAAASVLANNGDFAGAYAKYEQAHTLSNDPRLLFNMAVCARSMHDYARMLALLERYRRESASTMSADDRNEVDGALATVRTLVGTISLTVNEPGSSVTVDGDLVGTTPLARPLVLNLGKRKISVTKEGFLPIERMLDITGGSETPLVIDLAKSHPPRLVIASDADATIAVDRQAVARGRFDAALPRGPHDIEIAEPGKKAYRAAVDLVDGEVRTMSITLEEEKHAAAWPWIVGGAVLAAGVMGGYFIFRPREETLGVPDGQTATIHLALLRR